jgi:aspartate carbamoyltransferase catalytic subunit
MDKDVTTEGNMKHILTAEQFSHSQLYEIFDRADNFRETDGSLYSRRQNMELHFGRIMLSMFYEPSTRTRFSFELAAKKLGMEVVGTENAALFSSAAKGETLEDTIHVFNEYGIDAIALRTKEEGLARRAAAVSNVPILNGGDGKGEHPTQAVLDAHTVHSELGSLENKNYVFVGDNYHSRVVSSDSVVFSTFPGNTITSVSIPELHMRPEVKAKIVANGAQYHETTSLYEALESADVVLVGRLQVERLAESDIRLTEEEIRRKQEALQINNAAMNHMHENAILLHPLPKLKYDIDPEVDADSRAKYFRQAGNGLYVRMAMLDMLMQEADAREPEL